MKQALFLFLLAVLSQSCNPTKVYTLDNYPDRRITFGNGGGFTGMTETYILFENGQLFYSYAKVGGNMQSLPPIETHIVDQVFTNFYTLHLDKALLNDPGNMTYFMKLEGPKAVHSLKWGGNNQDVNPKLVQLYRNLVALGRRQKNKPIKM